MLFRSRLPPETIVTNDAGNFAIWVHRFYSYTGFRTQLAPTSGAMGYGVQEKLFPRGPRLSFSEVCRIE